MSFRECRGPEMRLAEGRRRDLYEIHLVDRNELEESPLCGAEAGDDERLGVVYYLEERQAESEVGTVCEECKGRSVPFAVDIARDLEAEGLLGEAEEYRELVGKLLRETSQCVLCDQ